MIDIKTKYLGLKLKSPIIVGSSGLTDSPEKIKEIADNGAGAVVLKSIFEEEITSEYEQILAEADKLNYHNVNLDYFDYKIKDENITKYLNLIKESKKLVDIPIIASVNCKSSHEWSYFVKQVQEAGADAIEINMFVFPNSFEEEGSKIEEKYFSIVRKVLENVKIPVALKIGYHFSNVGLMIKKLSETGIAGLTLFNRFYEPDFNIENQILISTNILSKPDDASIPLRWVALMSKRVNCDLAASTGIHDSEAVIKQIMAGASAVQVVSSIYKNGAKYIGELNEGLKNWMGKNSFATIDSFKGKMSQERVKNPEVYERVQFMKYFRSHNE